MLVLTVGRQSSITAQRYVYITYVRMFLLTSAGDPCVAVVEAEDSEEEEEEELGGLFRVNRPQKSKKVQANALDCSHFNPDISHNWELEEVQYFLTELRLKRG